MAAVDAILQKAGSKEVKERLAAIEEAAAYAASVGVSADDAPALIDAFVPGLSDNNVKVAQGCLGVLLSIVTQLEEASAPFLGSLWPPLIEKMGDAKGQIRERAVDLAMAVATLALPPAQVIERLKPAFGHKNWRARESALLCLGRVLATSEGTVAGLPLKVTLPMVLKLVEDGQPAVREASTLALEQLHRHVGDMLLGELQRREIRPTILKAVLARLQQPRSPGTESDSGSQGSRAASALSTSGSAPTLEPQAQAQQRRLTSPAARASSARTASSKWGDSPGGRPGGGAVAGAASEEAGDVQPIAIYSERDLAREMTALAEHLNADGHRDEWTCRLAAVRKLQGLVLGGAAELDSFAPQLRTLVKGLCSCASDLRSSLVKESCALFELLARTLRAAFEPFAEIFVPVLLKNTYVTIQVISQTSSACIRSIILHVVPLKCLPKLVAGMTDKNSTVRSRSVEYAQLLLTHIPAVPEGERCSLERYADALTTALKAALADALADARAGARSCFWTLNAHFPSRCAKLLASLDANTQRLLHDERQHHSALPPVAGSAAAAAHHHGDAPRRAAPPERVPANAGTSRLGATARPSSADDLPSHAWAAGSDAGGVGGGMDGGTRLGSGSGMRSPRRARPGASGAESERGPSRGLAAREPPEARAASERGVPGAMAAPRRAASSAAGLGAGAGARRVAVESATSTPRDEAGCANGRGGAGAAAAAAAPREEEGVPALPLMDAASVLAKASSEVWSTRAGGCAELAVLMGSHRGAELLPMLDRVSNVLLERLADPHYKVVQAALEAVCALLTYFPHAAHQVMERLLPQLLTRVHDQRDVLKGAARTAVRAVQAAFAPEHLLPVLLRLLDLPSPKVRVAALELFEACCAAAPAYLGSAVHCRVCLQKLLPLYQDKPAPELRRAVLDALHAMHAQGGAVFLGQLALLPLQAQVALKRGMAERAPQLEAELAALQPPRRGSAAAARPPEPPAAAPPPSGRCGYELSEEPPPPAEAPGYARRAESGAPAPAARHTTGGARQPGATERERERARTPDAADSGPGEGGAARPLNPAQLPVPQLQQLPPAACNNAPPRTSLTGANTQEDWVALMPGVLRQLSSSAHPAASQREALLKLQKMAMIAPQDDQVWATHFEHVLEAVLRALQHADDKLREQAAACAKDLLRGQPQRFRAFTEHVLLRLLSAARDPSAEAAAAAEEALELLLSISDAHRCMAVLVPIVSKEPPPTLQLAVRLQSKLVGRFSAVQLLSILPQVLPPLFQAFKNQNADVRKAVVFSLVDMYLVLGEDLTPHLAELSTSQLKLVTIYINRTTKARADQLDLQRAE